MKILATGTTGGIGGAFASVARAAGHVVIEWNRGEFDRGDALPDGPFDAVAFATGECRVTPVAMLSDDAFAETLRVNCGLFLRIVREIVARRLYSPRGMRVIAVSSVSANEGWAGGAAYCASKGALSAMCRALDAELAPRGISVRAIEPRYVKTRMFDACAGRMGASASLARDPGDLAREMLEMLSAG